MDTDSPADQGRDLTITLLIGVGLTIVGGFIDNLGVTAMKLSHRALQELQAMNVKSETYTPPPAYWMTRKWMFGFCLFGVGNILNVVGLSYAPQSLFAALGALTLVWNALNSSVILGERLTKRIIFGTTLIFGGSCLAVLFGSTVEQNFSLDDLADQALSTLFLSYGSIIIAIICLTQMTIHVLEKRMNTLLNSAEPLPSRSQRPSTVEIARLGDSITSSQHIAKSARQRTQAPLEFGLVPSQWYLPPIQSTHDDKVLIERTKEQLSFLYPFFTGLIGSFTVLFAKSSTELVNSSLDGENQFKYAPTYVIMILTLVIGGTQIHWLNRGLALYDQLIIIPTFNVCYSFFSIMGGGTFFNEFRDFDITKWVVFPSSVFLTFIGVYFICVPGNGEETAVSEYYEVRRKMSEDIGTSMYRMTRGFRRKISRGFTEGSESLLTRRRIRSVEDPSIRTQTM